MDNEILEIEEKVEDGFDIKNLKVALENKILKAENVVIVPHLGIDLDAIGSAVALSFIAKKFKRNSCIVVDDPLYKVDHGAAMIMDSAKAEGYSILNREKYLQKSSDKDLFLLTDVNKPHRICLQDELKKCEMDRVVIIDHHDDDDTTYKAGVKYIDRDVSSASEIVTQLLCLYKMKYDKNIANYLLAGIYLDTNKLTKNANADTMRIVAKLLENGADLSKATELFSEDFISDRRVQRLIDQADFFSYNFATVMGREDEEFMGEELAKAADYLLKFRVDGTFAIGNTGNGISVSARSKGKINVGSIMRELGGGGNQCSAATLLKDTTVEETGKRLRKILRPNFYQE